MHCFSAMHRIGWLQKSRVVLLGSAPNNVSSGVKIQSSVLETESKTSAFDLDIPQFSGQLSQARYGRFREKRTFREQPRIFTKLTNLERPLSAKKRTLG
jgi:hypothetical protein